MRETLCKATVCKHVAMNMNQYDIDQSIKVTVPVCVLKCLPMQRAHSQETPDHQLLRPLLSFASLGGNRQFCPCVALSKSVARAACC